MTRSPSAARQRGISLIGLLFWGILIACTVLVGAKVSPTVMEYYSITKLANKVADSNPASVAQARLDFDRMKVSEYGIELKASDLQITKENDKVKIYFAYEREIHLFGPTYLLMKYEGQSN